MLGISTTLFNGTLHKTLGERISVLPWAEHFNGSVFVKKCPGRITSNRLEARGVDCGSTKAHRPLMAAIAVIFYFLSEEPPVKKV